MIETLGPMRWRSASIGCEPREAGEVPRFARQHPGGGMVGMQIVGVMRDHDIGCMCADQCGELLARGQRHLDATVGEVQVRAQSRLQERVGRGRLARTILGAAARAHLALRQVDDAETLARAGEREQRTPHRNLGVVGMRGDDEHVEFDGLAWLARRA